MYTIPSDLQTYANQAAGLTGLDPTVILAQWISENGWSTPSGYNFGNIMGSDGKPVVYSTPLAGVQAYADFLKQPNYTGVMATAGKDPQTQMAAIINSPWDAGHYQNGQLLMSVWSDLTGTSVVSGGVTSTSSTPASTVGISNQLKALHAAQNGTGLDTPMAIGVMIIIAVLGLVFVGFGIPMMGGGPK